MKIKRTKEEKSRLIADYKSSGQSMTEWCKKKDIPTSTLAGWLRGKNPDVAKSRRKAKFIEVSFSADTSGRNNADITVEYKSFKLTVPAGADLKSLENLLKVVTQLNV